MGCSRGLHTRTAVVRLPLRQVHETASLLSSNCNSFWGFHFSF